MGSWAPGSAWAFCGCAARGGRHSASPAAAWPTPLVKQSTRPAVGSVPSPSLSMSSSHCSNRPSFDLIKLVFHFLFMVFLARPCSFFHVNFTVQISGFLLRCC